MENVHIVVAKEESVAIFCWIYNYFCLKYFLLLKVSWNISGCFLFASYSLYMQHLHHFCTSCNTITITRAACYFTYNISSSSSSSSCANLNNCNILCLPVYFVCLPQFGVCCCHSLITSPSLQQSSFIWLMRRKLLLHAERIVDNYDY